MKPNAHGLPNHLRKDDNGYFIDYFIEEGGIKRRKRVRLGQIPLAQAKKILAQHMQDIVTGKFLAPSKPTVIFNDAADSYLAYTKIRCRTFERIQHTLNGIKAYFGNTPLNSFTPDLVEAFLNHRKTEGNRIHKGRTLSNATLNQDIFLIKAVIRRALLNRQVERDPIVGIRRFKANSRNRTLEPEEYQRLVENCSSRLEPIVVIAYRTAMRRGEILGLRWDQIDFGRRIITLEAADTKTQERREIPLDDQLVKILQRIPRVLGVPNVFTFRGKNVRCVDSSFRNACRKAGITGFHFHDLRHCAVTNFRKAGVSDNVIMSISGHKTHAMFARYDRVDREDRMAALLKVRGLNDTGMTPDGKLERGEMNA